MIAEALAEAALIEGEEPALSLSGRSRPQVNGHEVGEVGEVCVAGNPGESSHGEEPPERCWWDDEDECWMTDFPPPSGFDGHQEGRWGDEDYERECTAEESKILSAALEAELADDRAEDEKLREAWFAELKPPGKASKRAKRVPA